MVLPEEDVVEFSGTWLLVPQEQAATFLGSVKYLAHVCRHGETTSTVTDSSNMKLKTSIIISIIVINIHIPHFTAVRPVLPTVPVPLTKHFLFTVLPKTV
jgi:hypothetical protein